MARFGSVGTQYFDVNGDPLIYGKLYFKESGTDTGKNTYADVNLSIPNSNPVILTAAGRQPNIFFSGVARVILTDKDEVVIDDKDPVGEEGSIGVFSPWNTLTIYTVNDIVEGSDGSFYISITDGNQGNDPISSPSDWTRIKFIRVWNTTETYAAEAIVQASNGLLYRSRTGANLNNDPVLDLSETYWGPVTPSTTAPVIRSGSKVFAYRNF